jgi:hypothetical protein
MWRLVPVLFAVLVADLACTSSGRDDYDSGSGRRSDGGTYFDAGTPPDGGMDSECQPACKADETCRNKVCEPLTPPECLGANSCVNDNDCGGGTRCNTALTPPRCYNLYCGKDQSPCSDTLQCSTGLGCVENHCQRHGQEGEACSMDWACEAGLTCLQSKCRVKPAASSFSTHVTGSYKGNMFKSADAWTLNVEGWSFIAIANRSDYCSTANDAGLFLINIGDSSSDVFNAQRTIGVGVFTSRCETDSVQATATVTIWHDGNIRYGSFDIPLPNNESLKGTFKTRDEICEHSFYDPACEE